jgi:NAD(P)-dependent dehydrogenase (short-subunit alcohol dehydrogenase family)
MKNIVVIGGANGIGFETVKLLQASGNMVWATYNTGENRVDGVQYMPLNVLDGSLDLSQLPDTLDGLVYAPGAINLKPFTRFKDVDFMADYQLQVVGAVKVIQQVLPLLKKSSQASVVLFSTVAVQMGFNFHSLVAASKGAVEGLTRALAAEFAPQIRVNCVAPSITQTPLANGLLNSPEKIEANAQRHPLKAIGDPETVAQAVVFLLSDHSKWTTGQILHVDGGASALKV